MDSKLKLLLDTIKINEENIKYFENGTLDKIIGNKAKDSYCFYIKLDTNLPVNVYEELINKINDYYSSYECKVWFNVDKINKDYIIDYFKYLIKLYSRKCSHP